MGYSDDEIEAGSGMTFEPGEEYRQQYDEDDIEVHSGETRELNEGYKHLQYLYKIDNESGKLTADIGKLWDESMAHWESEEGGGDARPFFDSMKNIREVPASAFVLAFLAGQNDYPARESDLRKLRNFAETFAWDNAAEKEEDRIEKFAAILAEPGTYEEKLLSNLAVRVRTRLKFFSELDRYTNDLHWPGYFHDMIFNPDFSSVRDIAFAYAMESDQFEAFLQKVLHRSWLNFFEWDEILTYIVLRYYRPTEDIDNLFELYDNLRSKYETYKNRGNRKAGGRHPKGLRDVRSSEAGSKMVQEEVDGLLIKIEKVGGDVFDGSGELFELLDWVDDRNKKNTFKRSAKKVFDEELKELHANLSDIINRQDLIDKAIGTMSIGSEAQECHPLTIMFVSSDEYILKKGIHLYCDSTVKKEGMLLPAKFELMEDVHLITAGECELSVPVDPMTVLESGEKAPAKMVKDKHVQGLFRIDTLPAGSPDYDVTGKYSEAEPELLEIHPGPALHFAVSGKEHKGVLNIVCAPGTTIYEGTVFSFKCSGKSYRYKVRESVTAESAATASLPVMLMNGGELWEQKTAGRKKHEDKTYVVNTNANIKFEPADKPCASGLNIIRVTNTKPVSAADPGVSDGSVRNREVRINTLLSYLYGKEYKGVTCYGPSYFLNTSDFKAARLSYNSVSAFPKSEVKVRNLLLTLVFLNFVSYNLDEYKYAPGIPRTEGLILDFTTRCNDAMAKCGLQDLYSGNAYDEFLRRLLTSQDPMNLYINIFSDKHLMTQYINVKIPKKLGEWRWKVECKRPGGVCETWCEGAESAGPQLITMPRLAAWKHAEYEIEILYSDKGGEKSARRKIGLNQEQECEISI